VTRADFDAVRAVVVDVCTAHGSIAPDPSSQEADFYVVEDLYGDERRIHVEPRPSAITAAWLLALARRLEFYPLWDVLIGVGEGIFLRVRCDSFEVVGWPALADLAELVRQIRDHVTTAEATRQQISVERRAEVRRLLRTVCAVDDADVAFVAAYGTRSDGIEGDSVWLLHRQESSVLDLDTYRFEPDAIRPSVFWALHSGELLDYTPATSPPDRRCGLLAEWALVEHGRPVRGATRLRVRKGQHVWLFNLLSH
jgi:hypothetical protein